MISIIKRARQIIIVKLCGRIMSNGVNLSNSKSYTIYMFRSIVLFLTIVGDRLAHLGIGSCSGLIYRISDNSNIGKLVPIR